MIHADLELIALVFGFYLFECVYFLKPSDVAYTGVLGKHPRKWEFRPSGYTLLGRHLCVVNPLRIDAGVAVFHGVDWIANPTYSKAGLRAAVRLMQPSLRWLRVLCSTLGFVLFVLLPVVVCRQLLPRLWAPLLAEVLLLHLATCLLFAMELRRWQTDRASRVSRTLAICLNPVAAIRCIDVLSRVLFEELGSRGGPPKSSQETQAAGQRPAAS